MAPPLFCPLVAIGLPLRRLWQRFLSHGRSPSFENAAGCFEPLSERSPAPQNKKGCPVQGQPLLVSKDSSIGDRNRNRHTMIRE